MHYQPKGSMCMSCKHQQRDCSYLRFESMQPIKHYSDKTIAVKCTDFIKVENG